jgi:hypothetical protein
MVGFHIWFGHLVERMIQGEHLCNQQALIPFSLIKWDIENILI